MTQEEKLKYMDMAGGIVGFKLQEKDLDMLVNTYELILKKKGKTDIHDLVSLRLEVNKREDERQAANIEKELKNKLNSTT